jgi:hypothetical protein
MLPYTSTPAPHLALPHATEEASTEGCPVGLFITREDGR